MQDRKQQIEALNADLDAFYEKIKNLKEAVVKARSEKDRQAFSEELQAVKKDERKVYAKFHNLDKKLMDKKMASYQSVIPLGNTKKRAIPQSDASLPALKRARTGYFTKDGVVISLPEAITKQSQSSVPPNKESEIQVLPSNAINPTTKTTTTLATSAFSTFNHSTNRAGLQDLDTSSTKTNSNKNQGRRP
jgi:hypothetical protein